MTSFKIKSEQITVWPMSISYLSYIFLIYTFEIAHHALYFYFYLFVVKSLKASFYETERGFEVTGHFTGS